MTVERPNTVAGLVEKRAEIAGEIGHLQARLRDLLIALDNLDSTIRLFDPNYRVGSIKPKPWPPVQRAMHGDMMRVILGTLRDAKGPLSTKQLTLHVMAQRGVDTSDERNFKIFRQRVGSLLRTQRTRGVIRSVPGSDGSFMLWEIAV